MKKLLTGLLALVLVLGLAACNVQVTVKSDKGEDTQTTASSEDTTTSADGDAAGTTGDGVTAPTHTADSTTPSGGETTAGSSGAGTTTGTSADGTGTTPAQSQSQTTGKSSATSTTKNTGGGNKVTGSKAPTTTTTTTRPTTATTGKTSNTTAAHRHEWEKTTKFPATCTQQGYTLVEYSCGNSIKKDFVPALGHKMSDWSTVKASTNTVAGTAKRVCMQCPYEETKSLPLLPLTANANQKAILDLVNAERAKAGLKPLSYYAAEQAAADQRAKDIQQSFSHYRPDGNPFYVLLKGLGTDYFGCGENVAGGFTDPQKVMTAWMNSPKHKENILDPDFEGLVVGIDNGHWVQIFLDLE